MRSTSAVREFTDDPLPDEVLGTDSRQRPLRADRVVTARACASSCCATKDTRSALADLGLPAARRYAAQLANGESPWNPL